MELLGKAAQVQRVVQENQALEAAEESEFLQTKTIPTQEAMQELEKWRESLSDEVASLVKELGAVEPAAQENWIYWQNSQTHRRLSTCPV